MPKNVVICCDGTNNSFQRDLTNVALVSLVAGGVPGQHVYYDVGVGVDADPGMWTRVGATVSRWSGLAFGTGLVDNVAAAYQEIVDRCEPDDRLFLFGFSRGAYTVRVLAALLQHYGRLTPVNRHRVAEVVDKFRTLVPKEGSRDAEDPERRRAYLARTFADAATVRRQWSAAEECPVHFLGLWDTVSSLGWAYDPRTFPSTAVMKDVRVVRHALAIDERRAKFRTNRVTPVEGQDVMEVWFPGVHADVGGGYPAAESGLARVCLRWMLQEARAHGLLVNAAVLQQHGLDRPAPPADEQAAQHESLSGAWWPLEHLPLPHWRQVDGQWVKGSRRYKGEGWRAIGATDRVSEVVRRRLPSWPVKNAHWPAVAASVSWVP